MKRYEDYKDSGVEWIGKIPSHWQVKKLKLLTEILSCGLASTPQYVDEGVPFLSAQNVKNGKLDLNKYNHITPQLHKQLSRIKKVKKGDILQVRVGATIGNACVVDVDFDFSIYVSLSHIRSNSSMHNIFMKYILDSDIFKEIALIETFQGGGVGNLNVNVLENIKLPIPSKNEQITIANYICKKTSQIDNLINKKEELIGTLKISRQNLISETITKGFNKEVEMKDSGVEWIGKIPKHWELSKVKYKVDINKNVLSEKTNDEYEIKYIDIGSVNSSGEIMRTELMEFKDSPSRARRIIKSKDTIVSTVRTYLKAITWIDKAEENLVCSTGFAVLSPSEELDYRYLGLLFRSSKYINEIVKRSKGVSYPAITATEIGNMELILPPLQEQKIIADKLYTDISKIDRIISKTKEQIELLKKAKQKLITEVVTGKIDVRE